MRTRRERYVSFVSLSRDSLCSEGLRKRSFTDARARPGEGRKQSGIDCVLKKRVKSKKQKRNPRSRRSAPSLSTTPFSLLTGTERRRPFSPCSLSSSQDVSPPRPLPRAQSMAAWRGAPGDNQGKRGGGRVRNAFLMDGALKFCDGLFLCLSSLPHRDFFAACFLSADKNQAADEKSGYSRSC